MQSDLIYTQHTKVRTLKHFLEQRTQRLKCIQGRKIRRLVPKLGHMSFPLRFHTSCHFPEYTLSQRSAIQVTLRGKTCPTDGSTYGTIGNDLTGDKKIQCSRWSQGETAVSSCPCVMTPFQMTSNLDSSLQRCADLHPSLFCSIYKGIQSKCQMFANFMNLLYKIRPECFSLNEVFHCLFGESLLFTVHAYRSEHITRKLKTCYQCRMIAE